MSISHATSGSPYPVFIAGIKYRSILEAAEITGISWRWLYVSVEKNNGAPVVVRDKFIVSDFWVRTHTAKRKTA